MKITQKELKELLVEVAIKIVSKEEAEYFADEAMETQLRKSHRDKTVNTMKTVIADLLSSIENKERPIEFKNVLGASLNIDFNGHGPLLYIKRIHDKIEEMADKNGIAMISFSNSKAMHTLHSWVQGLAKRGIFTIATTNGGPAAVAPYNGTKGVFGTNPLAFGIHGKDKEIHCIDMATSEGAYYYDVIGPYHKKEKMRENIAVDQEGNPTTDPEKTLDFSKSKNDPISNMLPMGGGYKGYYLVYMLELLTSGLIGSPSSPEMSPEYVPEEHGGMIIAFSPKALGTENGLQKSVEAINNTLKKQKAKEGQKIIIPGEGNSKSLIDNKNNDIFIEDETFKKLKSLL